VRILVLNSGSSSQKSNLYEIQDRLPENPPHPSWEGKIEWDGDQADLQASAALGQKIKERLPQEPRGQSTERLLDYLWNGPAAAVRKASDIDIVGHRIVNGGREYTEPAFVTPELKAAVKRMAEFAPLHNRAELEGIETIARKLGSVPQVAVFDTGFHSRLPEAAAVYPGPYEWVEQGIRRYGFHGINHQYCSERAAQLLGKDLKSLKLVTCHLGNGCSLAAVRDGHSVDTTMGFTPLEGLMMGTRSGSVDPGILTYLMRQGSCTGEQLDEMLNEKSGLLGISGISGDMRRIVSSMGKGNARAKLAFDLFVHRLTSCIGSMAAILDGIEALVFTAGIGENSPEIRAASCANLRFLGVKLDPAKNAQSPADRNISLPGSGVPVLIVRAQEDWAIARACWRLASQGSSIERRVQEAGSA
jgi:acetate kinase